MRKIAALASAAALTMTLAACSDSSKPTKDEGADGMVTEDEAMVIQEASVECDSIITDSIIGN